jgi:hypothetical protein
MWQDVIDAQEKAILQMNATIGEQEKRLTSMEG